MHMDRSFFDVKGHNISQSICTSTPFWKTRSIGITSLHKVRPIVNHSFTKLLVSLAQGTPTTLDCIENVPKFGGMEGS